MKVSIYIRHVVQNIVECLILGVEIARVAHRVPWLFIMGYPYIIPVWITPSPAHPLFNPISLPRTITRLVHTAGHIQTLPHYENSTDTEKILASDWTVSCIRYHGWTPTIQASKTWNLVARGKGGGVHIRCDTGWKLGHWGHLNLAGMKVDSIF